MKLPRIIVVVGNVIQCWSWLPLKVYYKSIEKVIKVAFVFTNKVIGGSWVEVVVVKLLILHQEVWNGVEKLNSRTITYVWLRQPCFLKRVRNVEIQRATSTMKVFKKLEVKFVSFFNVIQEKFRSQLFFQPTFCSNFQRTELFATNKVLWKEFIKERLTVNAFHVIQSFFDKIRRQYKASFL